MSDHTCRPDHPGVLADGCERCAEHAERPLLLGQEKLYALWDVMVAVEYAGTQDRYATTNEANAARELYRVAVWMERTLGPVRPWRPLSELRLDVR